MAGKKSKNEIETLRGELKELTEAVWALRDQVSSNAAASSASRSTSTIKGNAVVADLQDAATTKNEGGVVSSFGYYESPDNGGTTRWALNEATVSNLSELDTVSAASTLAAVGHPQRLAILGAILSKPTSAGELVETLSLGTTGAAYHHLNVLQAAGFVTQMQRGIFRFRSEKVPVFLTMLAALNDDLESETEHPA
ncbi:MAG: winged helix-turn-helix domain-containing protein [Thermomicrobiales bacterium]